MRGTPDGLDYMLARYCNSGLAKFLEVDPSSKSISLEFPQSWNRYTYALNNPLKYVDPHGRVIVNEATDFVTHTIVDLALTYSPIVQDLMNDPNVTVIVTNGSLLNEPT